MKVFFSFLLMISFGVNASCIIKSSAIILVIDNNIQDHEQIISETNCKQEVIDQFMAIATNASGTLNENKLNLYLKKVNTSVKLIPNAITIVQLEDLLRKRNIVSEDSILRDIKQLSNKKAVALKNISDLKISCNDCEKTGSRNINIIFHSPSGNEKNLWITLDLLKKRFALVAKKTLNPFTSNLSEEMFKKVEMPLNENIDLFQATNQLRFYKTNKSIAAGEVIKQSDLSPLTLVQSGRKVKVLINRKNVQLKTIAISRSSGSFGDLIEVFNPSTKKKVLAEVIDKNLVEVKL